MIHVSYKRNRLIPPRALGLGRKAIYDPRAAGRDRGPGHRGVRLLPRPRRPRKRSLRPAHGRPSDQNAPGRRIFPHDRWRVTPPCHLQDGGRCNARVPDRSRPARPGRHVTRIAPEGRRLVHRELHPRNYACSRQGAGSGRVPASRRRSLLSAISLHRRQSASEGPTQAYRRSWRRKRLQSAARLVSSSDARRSRNGRFLRHAWWPTPNQVA